MPATGTVSVANGATLAVAFGSPNQVTSGTTGVGSLAALVSGTGSQARGHLGLRRILGLDTSTASTTYAGAINNTNAGANMLGLNKLGGNMLTLTGSNKYSGLTTISAGTLAVGNGGGASIGSTSGVSLSNGAALVFNHSDPVTLSTSITGTGSLTQAGNGTLTLATTQGFSGATVISGGVLKLPTATAANMGLGYFKITNDATSGISTANVYTHAINPSSTSNGTVIVNGIPFANVGAGSQGPGSLGTQSYTYTGPGGGTIQFSSSIGSSNFGATAIGSNLNGWSGVTGNMLNLYSHFNYNTAALADRGAYRPHAEHRL